MNEIFVIGFHLLFLDEKYLKIQFSAIFEVVQDLKVPIMGLPICYHAQKRKGVYL